MGRIFSKVKFTHNRKSLRNNMPLAEQLLWVKLKNNQIKGYKFRRQHSIGKFVVDFYCPGAKLAIELDGDSHFETANAEKFDITRQNFIESIGIKVVRFSNNEVYQNTEGLLEVLEALLP